MKTLLLLIALLLVVFVLWLAEKTNDYRLVDWAIAITALVLGALAAINFL